MYRLIFSIILIITIISTVGICIKRPQMHSSVLVYNSDYKIVPSKDVKIEQQTIPVMEKTLPAENTVKIVTQETKPQTLNVEVKPVTFSQTKTQPVKKVVTTKTQPIKIQQTKIETAKSSVSQIPKVDTQKILANNQRIISEKNTLTEQKTNPIQTQIEPSSVKITPQKISTPVETTTSNPPKQAPKPKVLSAKEEEIAWNIWRSNIQNKIMQDTKLPPVPMGTVFRFTFDVDKYGKITNIQTWSETSKYTPYAIHYIAPVIKSYQGRSILNFPQGTSRASTKVIGAWRISTSSRYSTPQDYNDIERISK